MKSGRAGIRAKYRRIHIIRFEDQRPTSSETKTMVEQRIRWRTIDREWPTLKPDRSPNHGTHPTGSFHPEEGRNPGLLRSYSNRGFSFAYTVIVTTKTESAKGVVPFHNGRGSEGGIFGDAENDAMVDTIPCCRLGASQIFTLRAMIAHNLYRVIQMLAKPSRDLSLSAPPHGFLKNWTPLTHRIIQRAGRPTRPAGEFTLTMSANHAVREELLHSIDVVQKAGWKYGTKLFILCHDRIKTTAKEKGFTVI